jgi:hypothetical protein
MVLAVAPFDKEFTTLAVVPNNDEFARSRRGDAE